MLYTLLFFLFKMQFVFIILTYLVPVLFTFYIEDVLKLKKNNCATKRLTLSSLLVQHIISSIRINRMTTRSRWKFRIYTITDDLALYSFSSLYVSWPEDGPQWPKHVVSLIKQIKRQLCFDVPTPPNLYVCVNVGP